MQISSETVGRLLASGRNYAGQIIAFASGIGVMSAAQQKDLMDALGEIVNGVSMVFHGASSAWTIIAVLAAPIVGPLLARWASKSATTDSQALAVKTAVQDPNTTVSKEAKINLVTAAADPSVGTKAIVNPDLAPEPATPGNVVSTPAAVPAA
jgi:hypothetical protein